MGHRLWNRSDDQFPLNGPWTWEGGLCLEFNGFLLPWYPSPAVPSQNSNVYVFVFIGTGSKSWT